MKKQLFLRTKFIGGFFMENMTIVRKNEVTQLPISWIRPSPYQARYFFDINEVNDLAKSIKQFGVLQPICVRKLNAQSYEVVFGERRLKACKAIGLFYIPCIITDIGDRDCAAVSLIENIQCEKPDFFETAKGIYDVMSDYGYSTFEIAKIMGKDESYVLNKLQLLNMQYEFRRDIIENGISENQVIDLIRIKDSSVIKMVLDKIILFELNPKKTKILVDEVVKIINMGRYVEVGDIDDIISKIDKANVNQKIKIYIKDIKFFTNTICQAVDTMNLAGVKTECKFNEDDDNLEVRIKVQK